MYNNKRSVMGKWKRTLIAAALTASMILALPVWNVGSAEATEADEPDNTPTTDTPTAGNREFERLNWDETPTLTITRDNNSVGNLEVDLYLVATAKPVSGYDTYTLELQPLYNEKAPKGEKSISDLLDEAKETEYESGVNASYRQLAQKVAAKALELKYKPIDTIKLPGEPTKELQAGMYLVVPHGAGMKPEQYIRKMKANVADEDAPDYFKESGDQYVTIASSEGYIYSYLPELISIPSKEDNGGAFNTAQRGNWLYDVTATLKSQKEVQTASLEIVKKLDLAPLTTDSCVFEITAVFDNRTVLHTYKSINFGPEDKTQKKITLENLIPVGSTVTVKEEKAGASYEIKQGESSDRKFVAEQNTESKDVVVTAENGLTFSVTFNNTRTGSGGGSGAITNNYKYSATTSGWGNPTQQTGESVNAPADGTTN